MYPESMYHTPMRFVAILLTTGLLAGCAQHLDLGPLPDSAPVAVDSNLYVLTQTSHGWETTIGFTFTNVSDREIEIENCQGAYFVNLEAQVNGAWETAWSPVIPLCLSAPIVLAPGATHEKDLLVTAGEPGSNTYPQFEIEDLNRPFRINLVAASWQNQETVPEQYRISAPFLIKMAD